MSVLLRVRHRQEAARQARILRQIAREVGVDEAVKPSRSRPPGDRETARGLPIVGGRGSIGGAIRGTKPGENL